MAEDPKQPIHLLIHSCGGLSTAGFAFYDSVRALETNPLVTVALGAVDSVALIFYMAGKRRIAGSHTAFLIHEVSRSYERPFTLNLSEFKKGVADLQRHTDYYAEIVASNSSGKMPARKIKRMMIEERALKATEAMNLGIATEMI